MFFQYVSDNLAVMSIGFLLNSGDDAVIWRGPKKNGKLVTFYIDTLVKLYHFMFKH